MANPWEAIVRKAFEDFSIAIENLRVAWIDGVSRMQDLLVTFTLLSTEAARQSATQSMGIAESDIRAVILYCPKRGAHVWLWNHRRIPFPPDWSKHGD